MSFATATEERLRGRPHVGVVMHFEGLDVPALAARLRALLEANGLRREDALEEANGSPVYSAVAPIADGGGMELWVIVTEKQGVGCKLELRLFHEIEESAQADEYLARLSARVSP